MTVTPAAGALVVGFSTLGDATIRSYQITAVPQAFLGSAQPPLVSRSMVAGTGCRNVTVRLTGLVRGVGYQVEIEILASSVLVAGVSAHTVGRYTPVTVL